METLLYVHFCLVLYSSPLTTWPQKHHKYRNKRFQCSRSLQTYTNMEAFSTCPFLSLSVGLYSFPHSLHDSRNTTNTLAIETRKLSLLVLFCLVLYSFSLHDSRNTILSLTTHPSAEEVEGPIETWKLSRHMLFSLWVYTRPCTHPVTSGTPQIHKKK